MGQNNSEDEPPYSGLGNTLAIELMTFHENVTFEPSKEYDANFHAKSLVYLKSAEEISPDFSTFHKKRIESGNIVAIKQKTNQQSAESSNTPKYTYIINYQDENSSLKETVLTDALLDDENVEDKLVLQHLNYEFCVARRKTPDFDTKKNKMVKTSQFVISNFVKRKVQQLNGKLLEPNNGKDIDNLMKKGGLHLMMRCLNDVFQTSNIIFQLDHFPELIRQLNENIPIVATHTEKTLFRSWLTFHQKLANKIIYIAGKDPTVLESITNSFELGKIPTLITLINAKNRMATGNQSDNFLKELIWNVKTFEEIQSNSGKYSNLKKLLSEICYWLDSCKDKNDKTPLDYLFNNQPELLYFIIETIYDVDPDMLKNRFFDKCNEWLYHHPDQLETFLDELSMIDNNQVILDTFLSLNIKNPEAIPVKFIARYNLIQLKTGLKENMDIDVDISQLKKVLPSNSVLKNQLMRAIVYIVQEEENKDIELNNLSNVMSADVSNVAMDACGFNDKGYVFFKSSEFKTEYKNNKYKIVSWDDNQQKFVNKTIIVFDHSNNKALSCINCETKQQEIIPISYIIKYKSVDTYSEIKEAFSKLQEYSDDDLDVLISQELTFNDFKVLKLQFKKNLQYIPPQFFYLINDIKEISPDFSIEYLLNVEVNT